MVLTDLSGLRPGRGGFRIPLGALVASGMWARIGGSGVWVLGLGFQVVFPSLGQVLQGPLILGMFHGVGTDQASSESRLRAYSSHRHGGTCDDEGDSDDVSDDGCTVHDDSASSQGRASIIFKPDWNLSPEPES